ncbi:MAG: FprA family A-type flavoprotein, partial [Actinomycetota bacterium]
MNSEKLAEGIYWVGAIDWDIREFHGLSTLKGGTYNSYLIVDEKIVLIDAVKTTKIDVLLSNISGIVDPADIDYVISNHAEPDHSGGLARVMEIAKNARLVATPNGARRLSEMYRLDWDILEVKDGDELATGKRTLKFIHAPLLHWPETMFTYEGSSRILFSCDAFGAHIATSERFTDEVGVEETLAFAKKYYAFLVAPFRKNVLSALDKTKELKIDVIAPSHGPVWRSDLDKIINTYDKWASREFEDKATIVYGT